MKSPVTLLLGLFFSIVAHGQVQNEQTRQPEIMPVSPKAFEFQKYTEVPVSRYTGVPSISIPIYTIKANGIEMPLNLSYHSNGIKVNEEAGWTGLGWSLFAGGSITQIVKGFDDFGVYKWRDNEARAIFDAANYPSSNWMSRFDRWIVPYQFPPPPG